MIRFTDNHAERLKRITPARMAEAMGAALLDGAETIAEDARHSIVDGAISGAGHIASAPGQAPNADTHDLDRSIHVGELIETPAKVQTAVIADSGHAWIELGGANMEERPYMRPAVARNRAEVVKETAAAVSRVVTA